MLAGGRGTLSSARLAGLLLILIIAGVVGVAVRPPSEASAGEVLWVNDLRYGSVGGGFYLDTGSGQVWTAERGWHLFSPSPSRAAGPLWVNDLDYGSVGGGFYWDPLSGLVWTAERGWRHLQF